jgi:hypothetical protein
MYLHTYSIFLFSWALLSLLNLQLGIAALLSLKLDISVQPPVGQVDSSTCSWALLLSLQWGTAQPQAGHCCSALQLGS